MCTLTFLGGAGTVTGSKFLLNQVLIDCGLYQGSARRDNWKSLASQLSDLQSVVISHAERVLI